jgi:hypothetical protein
VEKLDRCRIFDSTDFEKLDETTSGRHFRRKFLEREVGDQKVSSQEKPVSTRRSRGFENEKIKIIFGGFQKSRFPDFGDFEK